MILIRLSAQDVRTIQGAKLPDELAGVRQMVLDRMEQAKLLKQFGKEPKVRAEDFRWKQALRVAKEVLGDNVTFPKITDYLWYKRVNGAIMHHGMDAEYVRKLAEYGRDHLRMPIKLDFLITQHTRILAGEFDGQTAAKPAPQTLQEIAGPQLPEE